MDKALITLYGIQIIINAGYSILAPFYPLEAFKRDGTNFLVGTIFSVHALTSFISSLILGKFLNFFGKRNLILIGTILFICGMVSFGLIYFVSSK